MKEGHVGGFESRTEAEHSPVGGGHTVVRGAGRNGGHSRNEVWKGVLRWTVKGTEL